MSPVSSVRWAWQGGSQETEDPRFCPLLPIYSLLVPPTVQVQWEINRSQSPGRLNKDCTTALFPEGRSGRSTDDFHSEITYLSDIFRALLHFKLPSKIGCQFFFLSIHFCVLFWNETHSSLKFSIPFFLGQYLYEIGRLKALHLLIKV